MLDDAADSSGLCLRIKAWAVPLTSKMLDSYFPCMHRSRTKMMTMTTKQRSLKLFGYKLSILPMKDLTSASRDSSLLVSPDAMAGHLRFIGLSKVRGGYSHLYKSCSDLVFVLTDTVIDSVSHTKPMMFHNRLPSIDCFFKVHKSLLGQTADNVNELFCSTPYLKSTSGRYGSTRKV